MHHNSRFAVAIHVLALASGVRASHARLQVTSEQMAESVNTNPVVIRRILGSLREAQLVASQPGPGGGWRLTRAPEEISLRDVYRALEVEPLFALPRREPNADCVVGKGLPRVIGSCFQAAEAALEARLAEVTVADVIACALIAERSDPARAPRATVAESSPFTFHPEIEG